MKPFRVAGLIWSSGFKTFKVLGKSGDQAIWRYDLLNGISNDDREANQANNAMFRLAQMRAKGELHSVARMQFDQLVYGGARRHSKSYYQELAKIHTVTD